MGTDGEEWFRGKTQLSSAENSSPAEDRWRLVVKRLPGDAKGKSRGAYIDLVITHLVLAEQRCNQIAVELTNRLERDLLRADLSTLTDIGATAKALVIMLGNHGLDP